MRTRRLVPAPAADAYDTGCHAFPADAR